MFLIFGEYRVKQCMLFAFNAYFACMFGDGGDMLRTGTSPLQLWDVWRCDFRGFMMSAGKRIKPFRFSKTVLCGFARFGDMVLRFCGIDRAAELQCISPGFDILLRGFSKLQYVPAGYGVLPWGFSKSQQKRCFVKSTGKTLFCVDNLELLIYYNIVIKTTLKNV